jgi:hypothetical protein
MINTKQIIILSMLFAISACTTLSNEDRSLIDSIKATSETAKYDSQRALRAAEIAVENAMEAKEDAAHSAEKAERIFKQSQRK